MYTYIGFILFGVLSLFAINALVVWASARRSQYVTALLRQLSEAPSSGTRTPVTLVTGFLGSGKTTLLNNLLRHPPSGLRIAVIENERGAIPLDHELLLGAQDRTSSVGGAVRVLLLSNGCMCCSTGESTGRGDMERSLEALLELAAPRHSGGGGGPEEKGKEAPGSKESTTRTGGGGVDHVVIEMSGLGDPAPLIHALLRLGGVEGGRFFLAGVVTVADAGHLPYHLDARGVLSRGEEAGQQVAYGDIVLVNKCDSATPAALAHTLGAIQAANPTARVIPTVQCAVDPGVVLDVRALDPAKAMGLLGWAMESPPPPPHHGPGVVSITLHLPGGEEGGGVVGGGGGMTLGATAPRQRQKQQRQQQSQQPQPQPQQQRQGKKVGQEDTVDLPREEDVMEWVRGLMEAHGRGLYRVKGMVRVCGGGGGGGKGGGDEVLFLQGVHESLQVARMPYGALVERRRRNEVEEGGEGCGGKSGGPPPLTMGIVVIGRGLNVQGIREGFERHVWGGHWEG